MIWTFIGIIVLVAIITGTTLHEAFWGIVSFSISLTIFLIVLMIIKESASSVKNGITSSVSARNKLTPEQRRQRRINAIKNDGAEALFGLALFSPLLITALLYTTCQDFTSKYPLLAFIVAVAPFFVALLYMFFIGTKGQTVKHRIKTFGRMSWGLTKMFFIVLGVILVLGLIFALLSNFK